MRVPAAALSLLAAVSGWAQTSAPPGALLAPQDLNRLCSRAIQLMEAGGVAVPTLARAAAPFIEGARASCRRLQSQPEAAGPTYALLLDLRAYGSLSDAALKPYPFPMVARDQLAELRDATARLDAHFRALLEAQEAALRAPDRDNVSYYREQNRLLPAPDPKGRRVVLLGDSITSQWRIHEYFPEEDFINRAIDGQITGQLLGRMKADVVDLRPTAVVIQGGTFDLTRNIPLTAIEDNYVAMADIARANNIKPVFASVLPVSDYYASANPDFERTATRPPAYIRALNDWIKALCAQRGYTYLDFYSALVDETGALSRQVSDDGLLPNALGYRLMAPVLARGIEQATQPAPAAPAPSKPATRKR